MSAYLYFAAACGILVVFFAGMAVGAFITECQQKKREEENRYGHYRGDQ